jgi:aryl-phospho-beta-D-glucosidase BglC (GH1 family)
MKSSAIASAIILLSLTLTGCGGGSSSTSAGHVQTAATVSSVSTTAATSYPNYNTNPLPADITGMPSNAATLAGKMRGPGYNIGNTMEANPDQTSWGNPAISLQEIQQIKAAGFTAVRLPVAWNAHADQTTGKISDAWMTTVKQAVQWCVDNGLYVIVNIHWDGGWLENNVTTSAQAAVNAKQKAFWQQIATALRGFDEHVLFASANEPNAADATAMSVLMSYHQTFVDAVRSTGGRNAYRVLVVQGPKTDIDTTDSLMNSMPTDTVSGRMMAEVHYYSPYQYTLMTADASWGNQFFYWGNGFHSTTDTAHNATWGEEAYVDAEFAKMKTKFVNKGIPVVLGEFGTMRRTGTLTGANLTLHQNGRAYFLNYVSRSARTNGMLPFYWDSGVQGNNSWAVLNRWNNTTYDPQALNALIRGGNGLSL